ncbi:hypothetical protein EDD15DRAFT_2443832 [Pisolithus albus]|nr:hypothetical protein EDD15DRAFT_2443832 [Pisolithus albus]
MPRGVENPLSDLAGITASFLLIMMLKFSKGSATDRHGHNEISDMEKKVAPFAENAHLAFLTRSMNCSLTAEMSNALEVHCTFPVTSNFQENPLNMTDQAMWTTCPTAECRLSLALVCPAKDSHELNSPPLNYQPGGQLRWVVTFLRSAERVERKAMQFKKYGYYFHDLALIVLVEGILKNDLRSMPGTEDPATECATPAGLTMLVRCKVADRLGPPTLWLSGVVARKQPVLDCS